MWAREQSLARIQGYHGRPKNTEADPFRGRLRFLPAKEQGGYKKHYNRLFLFVRLDLSALCHALLPSDTIHAIKYFTARVSARPSNPTAAHDQALYIRALKTIPNLSIKYGHFLTHSVSMCLTNVTPLKRVWVDKTEEKGSDVNLACLLVRDAFVKEFEVAVLITNDSDLAEPVRIVTQELHLPVGIINPHEHHSKELQQYAIFVKRIRQDDLISSQFPPVMTDAKGIFSKPAGW